MENISFQYPTWYILLCVLFGLGCALFLYYRDKTFREQSAWLNWLMGSFRFISITLLCILLLSPLLKSVVTDTKKPVIVFAQDQSESISLELDDNELATYQSTFQSLKEELGEDFELKEYAFGNEVREGVDFELKDKKSNISEVLSEVYDLYSNQNLGAVILASDGIYNEGRNPLYVTTKLTAPIYTIALGDTTLKRDLILKRVFHNRIAYLGDKFSVQVDIAAQNLAGSSTLLQVYKIENNQARKLQEIPIRIDQNDFFSTQEIIVEADQSGVQRYRVSLVSVSNEASRVNNSKDFFVDILDARQKILILADAPHPDVTAIRQSISKNKNYQLSAAYITDPKINVAEFDFIILHQLPSNTNPAPLILRSIRDRKIPHFYIAGLQTNYGLLNQIQSLVSIRADGRNSNEVQGQINPDFSLFKIDERVSKNIVNFAPLTAPFGDFKVSENAEVLFHQRISNIDTQYPLLVVGEQDGTKIGVLNAEGLWKWRLFDFLQHQNHDIFEEILGKTVQYLGLKEDKRKFRVSSNKNIFDENEPILMDAELYNNSYELINEPDVTIIITNSGGDQFNFTFNKTNRAYSLNAGILPVGNYTFTASTFSNGENLTYNGQFSVQPIQLEVYETTANHSLLRLLSEKFGGQMVYPGEISAIPGFIKEKDTVKPVIYETSKTRSIINLKWIFILLLGLITFEWFLRRYFGAY